MWPLQLLLLIACLEFTMRLLFYVSRDGSDHGDHQKQCINETEREVRFYRHDQWGFACLA